jgi:hypothetical protein
VKLYRRTVVTLNGEPTLTRAYYHCRTCRKGFCPLDQQLRLGRDPHSAGVRALAARFASYLSEREAAAELAARARIPISARSVQREAEAVRAALEAVTGHIGAEAPRPAAGPGHPGGTSPAFSGAADGRKSKGLPGDANIYQSVRTIFKESRQGLASEESLGMPQVPIGDGFLLYYFDNRPFRGPRIRPARLTLDPEQDLLTIEATGRGIWSFADSGGFVARPVTGDYRITLQILEKPKALYTGNGEENVKVGPMIREHVFLGARYAHLAGTSGRGVLWERRTSFLGERSADLRYSGAEGQIVVDDGRTSYPLWLRLTKVGPVITASQSNDGVQFVQVGAEQTPEDFGQMNPVTYAGIAFIASNPTGRGLLKVRASSLKIDPLAAPETPSTRRSLDPALSSAYLPGA